MAELLLGDCCPSSREPALARERAQGLAERMKAVADPTRLQILAMIESSENGSACVCDLTEPLGLSQPTVSHHLKKLADAGLISGERRGTWAYYSINRERFSELSSFFEQAGSK